MPYKSSLKRREAAARWRIAHPKKARSNQLRIKFGITLKEYCALRRKQKGRCAICGVKNGGKKHRGRPHRKAALAVDHCHITKTVRGLLCHACNTGIGSLQDSPSLLRAALRYLRGR